MAQAKTKNPAVVCGSYFGIFKVRPLRGSSAASGTFYTVAWNGRIERATCTCSQFNFRGPCKHMIWVQDRACFWRGGAVPTPSHAKKIANKRGYAKNPQYIGFGFEVPYGHQPERSARKCKNCGGPMIVLNRKPP